MSRARRRPHLIGSAQAFPVVASGVVLALVTAAGVLAASDRGLVVDVPVPEPVGWFVPIQICSAAVWIAASLMLMPRRDLAWSRLAAVAALSHAAVAAAYGWAVHGLVGGYAAPGASVAAGLIHMLLPLEMPVTIFLLVSLPTGKLSTAGLDRLGWLAVSMATAGVAVETISVPDLSGTAFASAHNPLSLGLKTGPLTALLIAPAALLAVGVLIAKWRRCHGDDRLALRWVVWTQVIGTVVVVPLIALANSALSVGVAQIGNALGLLVLVTVIRRQHLLGVERYLERTLTFAALAGVLAIVYAAVIAAGTGIIGGSARPVAAAAVAISVLPTRDRVGRAAARFVYGDRANAAAIVHGVAMQAASAIGPRELVERFLTDLVVGTGTGGASVELERHGTIASVGVSTDDATSFDLPLHHRGTHIGQLRVVPSAGETTVDVLAQRVAAEVGPHIAIVADACSSDIDLQHARARLIQGREEERRRLRHDLHDGLGPILTGVAFSADAASNLVRTDPDRAAALLAAARGDITAALDEIRRIVEDLRPPALDELGLTGAIRQHAQRFPNLDVTVSGIVDPTPLPAAVEVAAYRIAAEALTNVARHAGASRATVDVSLNGAVAVTVTDNGPASARWQPGVGLTSMRERARELGGELSAGPGASGGGCVVAHLPVETR